MAVQPSSAALLRIEVERLEDGNNVTAHAIRARYVDRGDREQHSVQAGTMTPSTRLG